MRGTKLANNSRKSFIAPGGGNMFIVPAQRNCTSLQLSPVTIAHPAYLHVLPETINKMLQMLSRGYLLFTPRIASYTNNNKCVAMHP